MDEMGKVEREILALRARDTFLARSCSPQEAWDQAYALGRQVGQLDMLEDVRGWMDEKGILRRLTEPP